MYSAVVNEDDKSKLVNLLLAVDHNKCTAHLDKYMVTKPEILIANFVTAIAPRPIAVQHESWPAPHKGGKLAAGKCAIYIFSLSHRYGASVQAGAHRVLKVGKAGPNCNARVQSQHYSVNAAPSTLARKLVETTILWPYLGIKHLSEADVRKWIEEYTDRDHFYLSANDNDILGTLEAFLKGRLGPVFEG